MLYKSRAIVLHSIRYGDTSLIVHLITEKYGRQAFMVKGVKTKKATLRANLFFPLNLLQIEAYYRPNSSLQRLKEAIHQPPYNTVHTNPVKSAVALFLAEMLFRIVPSEHYNPDLFDFIYDSLLMYDALEHNHHNFHLMFLIQLLKYEGFYPTMNYSDENRVFSLHAARFLPPSLARVGDMDEAVSRKFAQIMQCNYTTMGDVPLNSGDRMYLLNKLIEYLQLHLHEFAPIKSLSVLHEVFKF
ncbi:MAG: DNA repair protein RecO [Bacteroidales bacterium]|nr:DNA repair protein RecO [Bacteroidales bacterium]HOK98705.1 DNA repair protein RecO [Bacteroidales bacterium]HPO65603.1 DNA repair protein RecO [Bacteroidales bacterium]